MRTPRILLAVDGRPASTAAIRWAAERAGRTRSQIDIVSVATDDDVLLDDARSAVAAAQAEVLRRAPDAQVTTSVPRGNVFDALVELSASADLLVVGSDRPSPLGAFLHARLPMRLTGRVQCRLAVVPAGWSGEPGTSIAVGWDDGPAAAVAVDAAAEEAEAAGLPLHIHHVWSPVPLARYDLAGGEELTAAVEEDERLALARIVRETAARFPHVAVSGELHRGSGGAGILGYASQASLIVVGSHRRSTIGELFAGATSDDLIAGSSEVPVLVTPPASARSHDHQDDDDDHEDRDES